MPNIKSAKKRVKVTIAKHEANILKNSAMKTAVKKARKDATVENLNIANIEEIEEEAPSVDKLLNDEEDNKDDKKNKENEEKE